MSILKIVLSVTFLFPFLGYATPTCAEQLGGYTYHHSTMPDRRDGNIRDTLSYLFGKPQTKEEVDNRSELQKMMGAREFKTWFDFKNRTKDFFEKEIGLKPALVKHVETHQEGLLAKLMMIRQARFTVDLTYYIFTSDTTGYTLLNELKEALRRGVSVRFMVDSLGSINPKSPTHPELKALQDFARHNAGFMKDRFGNVTDQKAQVQILSFRSVNPVQIMQGFGRKIFRLAVNRILALMGSKFSRALRCDYWRSQYF